MTRPVTVGTAGHIDHGKSALVRALTGIDPDRLAEEQRRGMTLDLGFAYLDRPGGRRIGIVDVPGHEALVHTMLAGAGGIDLVLLVVAADEGVMPQTREHLDILRFLPITGGVAALNKIDLVDDPEWLAMVEEDVRALCRETALEQAPILRVSARTGAGLPELVATLDRLVAALPARRSEGPVRLPIDRSFTMQGFGTVVTGTLWNGTIRTGDALVLLPAECEVRVRGVQVHGAVAAAASAGSRVAVNLVGVEKDDVTRGDELVTPGAFRPTTRLDVRLRLLPHAPPLKHEAPLHLHLASGSVIGRVSLTAGSRLEPGSEAPARLRLDRPIVAVHGDRFVIRRYSPTETVGGGVVLNAAPSRRARLEAGAAAGGETGPIDLVVATIAGTRLAGLARTEVAMAAGVDAAAADGAISAALGAGALVERGGRLFAGTVVDEERRRIVEALHAYHHQVSWRRGLAREDLKNRVAGGVANRLFDGVLSDLLADGVIADRGGLLGLPDFSPLDSADDRRVRAAALAAIERGGASAPTVDDLRRLGPPDVVDRALQVLMDDGLVVAVGPELRYATGVLDRIRQGAVSTLRAGGEVTVATLRDSLGTSRKYALALLEFFDTMRVTRRVGDRRVLGPQADEPVGRR